MAASAAAREKREVRKEGRRLLDGKGGHEGNGKANGQAAPAAAELRGQLDKVRAAQAKLSPHAWQDADKKRKLDKQARELEPLLEAAELREMPAPPAGSALSEFAERDVPVAAIRITGNHREGDDQVEIARLAHLIKSSGGLQQRIGLRDAGDGTFELIWGNRRLAATKVNGDEEIPAKVYGRGLTADDVETLRSIDNLGKKDLTHVERALAVARNIDAVNRTLEPLKKEAQRRNWVVLDPVTLKHVADTGGGAGDGVAAAAQLQLDVDAAGGLHAYVGRRLGRGARWVKDHAYMADLGGEARKLLAAGRITIGHARELAKLKDKSETDRIAEDVARDESGLGGMSVADTRRRVIEAMCDLSRVPWDLHVAFGKDEKKGCHGYACSACPFNSTADPDLFEGVVAQNPERGVCTNPACFEVKEKIAQKKLDDAVAAARKEKKEHKVELTIRGLGAVINKFRELKPESLVRRVKKELEPKERKPSASRSEIYGRQLSPEEKAEADARGKFQEAKRKWAGELAAAVNKAVEGKPGRLVALEMIKLADVWGHLHPRGDAKKAARIVGDAKTKALFAHLKEPTFDGIAALEREASKARYNDFGVSQWDLEDMVPEAIDLLTSTLGVDPPPRPDEAAFLQEAKAKLAKKDAGGEGEGKGVKSKAKKKGKVPVPAGDVPDEASVDDMGDDGFGTDEED